MLVFWKIQGKYQMNDPEVEDQKKTLMIGM